MVVRLERLPMATWVVEAQELETEPLRYPALEKSQVRRQDDTDILFPIAGLITATGVLAGVVLYYKKKKRITGVQTEEE